MKANVIIKWRTIYFLCCSLGKQIHLINLEPFRYANFTLVNQTLFIMTKKKQYDQ